MKKLSDEEQRKVLSSVSSMLAKTEFGNMDLIKDFIKKTNTAKCRECNYTGIVNATSFIANYKYTASFVFKCFCTIGRNRKEAWPEWNFDINYKNLSY